MFLTLESSLEQYCFSNRNRCNIPGNDFSKGEELYSYLPPFPARGSGFHRYAFVLYLHERPERIDLGDLRRHLSPTSPSPALRQSNNSSLPASIPFKSRIFSTFDSTRSAYAALTYQLAIQILLGELLLYIYAF